MRESEGVAPPGRGPVDVLLVTSDRRAFHPRHYWLMALALQRAGMNVEILGQAENAIPRDAPVPVRWLPARRNRIARMASGPIVMYRAHAQKPKVIQVNSLDLLPWAVAARLVSRIPTIYDSNEDYAAYMLIKEWLPKRLRPVISAVVGHVEPWLASRLDATTVADEGTGRHFERGPHPPVIVHNFPWLSFAEDRPPVAIEHDITYHGSLPAHMIERIVGTASNLERRGVAARWCLAARELSKFERHDLEARIAHAGLTHRFDLRYDLPFREIPDLLARTRVGFIPLRDALKFRSNIPRKMFEYMSLGRPFVASDLPPIRSLVGDEECALLVPPSDEDAYAEALARLLADPGEADAMGARGRALILNHLNADREIVPYVQMCRALAEHAGGRE